MPRNMSFAMTTPQFLDGSKDVTRRLGWGFLVPDDIVNGVKKAMGLRKGETIDRLHQIQIISTRWEPLYRITPDDVRREGFPDWTPEQFIEFFCNAHRVPAGIPVNRIEFRHLWSQSHDHPA